MLLHEERAGPCLVPSNRTLHYRNTGVVTDPCSAPLYPAPHSPVPKSIAAGRERCAGWSCLTARFLNCVLLSTLLSSNPCSVALSTLAHAPACSTPIGTTIERFFAAAAGQHGKTAAPPANARPSPRVAGRPQPSIHAAGGEESPPPGRRLRPASVLRAEATTRPTARLSQSLERESCLLVLSLVSSTLPCIRQPRLRLRVLGICGFVLVCTQAFMGFLGL